MLATTRRSLLLTFFLCITLLAFSQGQTEEQVKKMFTRLWQVTGAKDMEENEDIELEDEMKNSFMYFKSDGTVIGFFEGEADTARWTYDHGKKTINLIEDEEETPLLIIKISDRELILESNYDEEVLIRTSYKYQPVLFIQHPKTLEDLQGNLARGFSSVDKLLREVNYKQNSTETTNGRKKTSYSLPDSGNDYIELVSKGDDITGCNTNMSPEDYLSMREELVKKGFTLTTQEFPANKTEQFTKGTVEVKFMGVMKSGEQANDVIVWITDLAVK